MRRTGWWRRAGRHGLFEMKRRPATPQDPNDLRARLGLQIDVSDSTKVSGDHGCSGGD